MPRQESTSKTALAPIRTATLALMMSDLANTDNITKAALDLQLIILGEVNSRGEKEAARFACTFEELQRSFV